MRLIQKTTNQNSILPIEEFFSDELTENVPSNSVEVSRFIVRHNDRRQSLLAKIKLISAGLAYTFKKNLDPILGVIEPSFERDLRIMKIPIRRIAEPKLISAYNDQNLGIEIDKQGLRDRLGETELKHMTMATGSYIFWGNHPPIDTIPHQGEN